MNIFEKVIRGDKLRRTRFHTENGKLIGLHSLVMLPMSALTWFAAKMFNYHPVFPWWVWGSALLIKRHLKPDDNVLEDGSGMSSLWLAKHCAHVISIEESKIWFAIVEKRASVLGVMNLQIVYGDAEEHFRITLEHGQFNVVVIDGPGDRIYLLREILSMQRLPRIIIYDNTDRAQDRSAFEIAGAVGYIAHSFCGFAPALMHATETTIFIRNGIV